ncbi:MAG: hypothetical protein ACI959_001472 [Limisphaerales bacterium]|jgi:hypothetical protein
MMSYMLKLRIKQIDHFMKYSQETQLEMFHKLIEKGKQTQWGNSHGYKDIKSVEDFQEQVPIQDYEDLEPWINRVMKGEQGLLWPSEIKWFAKSSGTTSARSKFIPVSKEALEDCHFMGGKDLMALYFHNNPSSRVFSGRGLVMGGSHQVNKLSEGSFYGDVSAVMMQNMPVAARFIRTPDLSIALMDDWEDKIEAMANTTLKQNVTHIAGVPTWTLVLIRRLFEKTGKDNLAEIWPNLELYIHGGVSFRPYKKIFSQLIRSSQMHYLETYNASEGFFGVQDTLDRDDMLLMLDYGIFYEFIPMDQMNEAQPKTVLLDQVEKGKVYALVISTNAGLWRYRIGDTVRFTDTNPYRVQVSGRIKHFINAFGEEVIVDNADRAIQKACDVSGARVRDYTAAPIYFEGNARGGHEWIIEFEAPPDSLTQFVIELDQALQDVNSDYAAKRFKSIALELPVVHAVKEGTFYKWLKSKGKLGGQHKVPRLSNTRQYVEEILTLL